MDDSLRKDITGMLKRYLSRRRSVWGDVAFLFESVKEEVRTDGVHPRENRPASAASAPKDELKLKKKHTTKGERRISDRWKGESIRYTTEKREVEQASLFSDSREEDTLDLKGTDLDSLEEIVSGCKKCPLSQTRTKTVFGNGSSEAKLLFIGEAPGREEDLQGLPFVGRAGQLLTKILASVGLSREEVYITNILKCRPPNNRDPNEEEVKACEPYLKRQIELLNPVLICALGRVAGQTLLKRNASLSFLRGGIHYYNDIKVVVTYHPAALLRNPNLKKDAWEDIKMIRKLYDEELDELKEEG